MTYKNLLVHIEPGAQAAGRLRIACALAARFGAGLIGVEAAPLDVPVIDPTGYAGVDAGMMASERLLRQAEFADGDAMFHAAAAAGKLDAQWYAELAFPADLICRHARSADLLVIGRGAAAISPQHSVDPGEILLRAGRPVLVVPAATSDLRLDHALIAWKDTREARRVLADSLPLLGLAGKVSIIVVCDADEAEAAGNDAAAVAAYLGRHGIAAAHEAVASGHAQAADAILRCAEDRRCDAIVCGAFGHGRLREWVFGGVTQHLLRKSPLACLFSH